MRFRSSLALLVTASVAGACSGARATELDDPIFGGAAPTDPIGAAEQPGAPEPGPGGDDGQGDKGKDKDGGKPADPDETACDDSGLALTATDPFAAAKALGLCKKAPANGSAWGAVDARLVKPDGTPLGRPESFGLLAKLGAALPVAGKAMLALSTGAARGPSDPGYVDDDQGLDKKYTHAATPGLARPSVACPGVTLGAPHDGVMFELRVRVPADARALSFSHQLFTSDYGEYVCSEFADVFGVTMDPKPVGAADGSIVFDPDGNLVSASSASFLGACAPGVHHGITFACPLGEAPLAGTGFEGKAATGWLRTTVPVTGGSVVTLRFALWDSGDGVFDTTVLLDELAFATTPPTSPKPTTVRR